MTRRLYQIFAAACTTLCALALSSCGDDIHLSHLSRDEVEFSESQTNNFEQSIHIVPEGVIGAAHIFYPSSNEVFLDTNEPVRIQAVFHLNGEVLDADIAATYYQSLVWKLDGKKINIANFRQTFYKPGEYECILQTIDTFGDTLRDTTKIFVNTPSGISLISPRNGYNLVDPFSDKEIVLKWMTTGIDPWETAICEVYGSSIEEDVWKTPMATVACDDNVSFQGPIVRNNKMLKKLGIDLSNNSISYYWGIVMSIWNNKGLQSIDTSNIFHFSTTLVDTDSSILNIPIQYKSYHNALSPDTRITIVNIKGDTLNQFFSSSEKTTETIKLEPQTGVTVYTEEAYFSEYKAKHFTIDIPEHVLIYADTVYLEDKTPPTIWPLKNEYPKDSPISFSLLDKGSGVALSKIDIHFDEPTNIVYTYTEPQLDIIMPIQKPMRVYIRVADNAGNQSAPVYWNVTPENDVQVLSGPYISKEELE